MAVEYAREPGVVCVCAGLVRARKCRVEDVVEWDGDVGGLGDLEGWDGGMGGLVVGR